MTYTVKGGRVLSSKLQLADDHLVDRDSALQHVFQDVDEVGVVQLLDGRVDERTVDVGVGVQLRLLESQDITVSDMMAGVGTRRPAIACTAWGAALSDRSTLETSQQGQGAEPMATHGCPPPSTRTAGMHCPHSPEDVGKRPLLLRPTQGSTPPTGLLTADQVITSTW